MADNRCSSGRSVSPNFNATLLRLEHDINKQIAAAVIIIIE